jgi:hypothetical protein
VVNFVERQRPRRLGHSSEVRLAIPTTATQHRHVVPESRQILGPVGTQLCRRSDVWIVELVEEN